MGIPVEDLQMEQPVVQGEESLMGVKKAMRLAGAQIDAAKASMPPRVPAEGVGSPPAAHFQPDDVTSQNGGKPLPRRPHTAEHAKLPTEVAQPKLPNLGAAPSALSSHGFETRGSFTVRKYRAANSFYLMVYGQLNHKFRCILRGYRMLGGEFRGNTVYTGFKRVYSGESQLHTSHIPRGIVGEF